MTRGRRPDPTLAPSRQLLTQRAFRQRRAAHLADLNERIKALEEENRRLTQGVALSQGTPASSSSSSVEPRNDDAVNKRSRRDDGTSEEAVTERDGSRGSIASTSSNSQSAMVQLPPPTQPTCQRCSSFEQCRSEIEALVMCVGNCLGKLQYAVANLQHGEKEGIACLGSTPQQQQQPPPTQGQSTSSDTPQSTSKSCCEPFARPMSARPCNERVNGTCNRRTHSSAGLTSSSIPHSASSSSMGAAPWQATQNSEASTSRVQQGPWQAQNFANGLVQPRPIAPDQPQALRLMSDAERNQANAAANNMMPTSESQSGPQINRDQWQNINFFRQTGAFPDQQQQQQQHDQRQRYSFPFVGSMHNADTLSGALPSPMFEIPNLTLPMQFSQVSATASPHPPHQQPLQSSNQGNQDAPSFTQTELNAVDDFGGDARKCCFGFYECDTAGNMIVRNGSTSAGNDDSRIRNDTSGNGAALRQQSNVMGAPAVPARQTQSQRSQ